MKRVMYMYMIMLCTTTCAMQPPSGSQISDESVLTFILSNNGYTADQKHSYISRILEQCNTLNLEKDTIAALESIRYAYSEHVPTLFAGSPPINARSCSYDGTPMAHILFFGYLFKRITSTKPLAIALQCGADINCLNKEGISMLAREMQHKNRTEELMTSRITFLLNHGAKIDASSPNALAHAIVSGAPNERLLLVHAIDQITRDMLQEAIGKSYRTSTSVEYYLITRLQKYEDQIPENVKKQLKEFAHLGDRF